MHYHKGVQTSKRKPNLSIRMEPEVLHQARVAAVASRKTLGQWLEEAIEDKLKREASNAKQGRG
ncbi:MAG: hypothetical protein HYX87_02230 [Chloroflexi bacterium]|nr:hypothetical protein [Chloroflexota bacterium]